MFVSQKLNVEMFGDTSKKKNMVIFIMEKRDYFLLKMLLLSFLINAKTYPQISGKKVYNSTLIVFLVSTKAIQDQMQKHFVREHSERGVKAPNQCVMLNED